MQAGLLLVQGLSGRPCLTFALCTARVYLLSLPESHQGSTRPTGLSAGACPTCCGRQHIRGVPQSHEIKLVEPPVLLVRRGHRVLAPLVDNLVSRVTVWKGGVQSRKDKGQSCGTDERHHLNNLVSL